jgi:uncharacterized YigZ family protein
MHEATLYTIKSATEGVYKEKGSKFLSFAYPLSNEEKIKEIIQRLKKTYYDAKHHCYAFRIGLKDFYYRLNDDGEPSGTAGKPIYGQIVTRSLTDILVVVVRYFGGTLLGTSGLVRAYRTATHDCLEKASPIEIRVEKFIEIGFPYEQLNFVMRIIKYERIDIVEKQIGVDCRMRLKVHEELYEKIVPQLQQIKYIKINILTQERG